MAAMERLAKTFESNMTDTRHSPDAHMCACECVVCGGGTHKNIRAKDVALSEKLCHDKA